MRLKYEFLKLGIPVLVIQKVVEEVLLQLYQELFTRHIMGGLPDVNINNFWDFNITYITYERNDLCTALIRSV